MILMLDGESMTWEEFDAWIEKMEQDGEKESEM